MAPRNQDYVPESYEDLYLYYINGEQSLCRQILRSKLPFATEDERESLAHDVWLRMHDHKLMEKFDPSKSNFGGMIFFTTRTVLTTYLSRKSRNPITGLSAGSIVSSSKDEDFEPGEFSIETLFTEEPKMEVETDAKNTVASLFNYARACKTRNSHTRDRSLLPLLNLLSQGFEPYECAECLNVTPSTVQNWIRHLRGAAEATI